MYPPGIDVITAENSMRECKRILFVAAFAFVLAACGDSDEGDGEGTGASVLPPQCQLAANKSSECRSCAADCCAECGPGSECRKYGECQQHCAASDSQCQMNCVQQFEAGYQA